MGIRDLVYGAYAKQLSAQIDVDRIPRHVGVVLDGNRRWASEQGSSSQQGHQAGAAKIEEFVGWCEEVGVEVVTLWLLSTDNLTRPPEELASLLTIITDTVNELAATRRWHVHPVGALDLLPDETARALKEADAATRDVDGLTVNVAVGYGGRRELVDAVRALLAEQTAGDVHRRPRSGPDAGTYRRASLHQRSARPRLVGFEPPGSNGSAGFML